MDKKIIFENSAMCRGCLKQSHEELNSLSFHKISLQNSKSPDNKLIHLSEIYTQCTGIELNSSWDWICEDCVLSLINFFKFRQMCQSSIEYLSKIETNIEQEQLSDEFKQDDNDLETNVKSEENIQNDQIIIEKESDSLDSFDVKFEHIFTSQETEKNCNYFVCDICSMKFIKKYRYEAHLRTHSGKNPWKCDQCTKSFKKQYTLKLHISTSHYNESDGKPKYICDICGNTYSRKVSFDNFFFFFCFFF